MKIKGFTKNGSRVALILSKLFMFRFMDKVERSPRGGGRG